MVRILSLLALLVVIAPYLPGQSPTMVGLYERRQFGVVTVGGLNNVFSEIRLRAVFTHVASQTQFQMPVVCTTIEGPKAVFPVYFTPPLTGNYTWYLEVLGAAGPFDMTALGPTLQNPASFICRTSSRRGWWRPGVADTSGNYPFSVVEPRGDGSLRHVRPLTTTHFSLLNPQWGLATTPHPTCGYTKPGSGSPYLDTLDWARDNGFNRIRVPLTSVSSRDPAASGQAPPWHPNCIQNHTVFAHSGPTTLSWDPTNIDFERFDLTQWAWIDEILRLTAERGLQVCVILTFNTRYRDYEEMYLATPPFGQSGYSSAPQYPPFDPAAHGGPGSHGLPSYVPVTTPGSPFSSRAELYYWYVVGRLAAHTNVHWCLVHEYDGGNPQDGIAALRPYPSWQVKALGELFRSIDPYLAWDPTMKLVGAHPRQGSAYAQSWATGAGFSPSRWQTLPCNVSRFMTTDDDGWRSAIYLQRGGELGVTSIIEAEAPLDNVAPGISRGECPPPWYTTPIAHRDAMVNGFQARPLVSPLPPPLPTSAWPIFIEEDWVMDNTTNQSNTAVSNTFRIDWNPFYTFTGAADSFSFLADNTDGIRTVYRSSAWMAGFIGQAYLSLLGPRRNRLTTEITTTSWRPLQVAAEFARANEGWRFTYDPGLVVTQNPPTPTFFGFRPPMVPRPRFELKAIGSKSDHGGVATRYLVYCPYEGTSTSANPIPSSPGPATLSLDLTDLGPGRSFPYVFINPDNGAASAPAVATTPTTPPFVVSFPAPPLAYRGEHSEYVLVIN